MENKSYNVREVAKILDIHPQTVLSRIHDGELYGYQEGKEWRITEKAIEEYRESKRPTIKVNRIIEPTLPQNVVLSIENPEKPTQGELMTGIEVKDMLGNRKVLKLKKVGDARWRCDWGAIFYRKDKQGFKKWYVQIPDDNKEGGWDTRRVPGVISEGEALVALAHILNEEREKHNLIRYNPEEAKKRGLNIGNPGNSGILWKNLIKEHYEKHVLKRTKIRYDYENDANLFGENRPVKEILRADLVDLRDDYVEEGKSNDWINRQIGFVGRVIGWGIRQGCYGLDKNPYDSGLRLDWKERKFKPISPDNWQIIWKTIVDHFPDERVPVLCGRIMGMRANEVQTLDWPDIHFGDKPKFLVRAVNVKELDDDEEPKIIPIPKTISKSLLKMRENSNGSEFVFAEEKKGILVRTKISDRFMEIVQKAGLWKEGAERTENITFHCLRATAITELRKAGHIRSDTSIMVGHHSEDMTKHYETLDETPFARRAVEKSEQTLNIGNLNEDLKDLLG